MNIRVLFYNVFLFLGLLSCTHDGDREIDGTGDASLSLSITIPQVRAKADGDATVSSLYVAIFGTSGEDTGKLIVAREVSQSNTIEEISPLKVGSIRLLLIANAPKGAFDGLTSLDQYLALTKELENKETSPTMSSGVNTYVLKPGENTIGLSKDGANQLSASPLIIYRTTARVYLNEVFLRPADEYTDEASFKLESVFMANVKNYTRYTSEDNWGAIEVTDRTLPNFFLTGESAELEGVYKEGSATLSAALRTAYAYDFRSPAYGTGLIANCAGDTYTVFENMQETAWHTLLILRGTYRYKDKNGRIKEIKDTYYPVVVNSRHDEIINVTEHLYVRRNVIYSIDVVIKGPGSNNPYEPADATLASQVEVQSWGEIVEHPVID